MGTESVFGVLGNGTASADNEANLNAASITALSNEEPVTLHAQENVPFSVPNFLADDTQPVSDAGFTFCETDGRQPQKNGGKDLAKDLKNMLLRWGRTAWTSFTGMSSSGQQMSPNLFSLPSGSSFGSGRQGQRKKASPA